jgi:hypothetical protein
MDGSAAAAAEDETYLEDCTDLPFDPSILATTVDEDTLPEKILQRAIRLCHREQFAKAAAALSAGKVA